MIGQTARIISKNFDGSVRKSWDCQLVTRSGPELLFVGEFDKEISHPELGLIRRGTISYEYYWLDRWYNIFRFHEPSGELRNFYCNVNMPPTFVDGVLEYIDLDLDLLVQPDFSYSVLDRDEFETNASKFAYPDEVKKNAEYALDELKALAASGTLPMS